MKWLEIIELRVSSEKWKSMDSEIQNMIRDMEHNFEKHKIVPYSSATIESDYSIHLTHESGGVERNGSTLGLHLVSLLKDFGMVNHSVWIEL